MRSQNGYTLVEMAVAVLILGIIAVASLPDSSSSDEYRLDVVANEIAQAIRFTRNEAISSTSTHGIEISQVTQKITVYKADMGGTVIGKEYTLNHPLDKKLYEFNISDIPGANGVSIANASDIFFYTGYTSLKNLIFDPSGTPKWTNLSTGLSYQLGSADVLIDYAGKQRTVSVAAMTGRVSIQ